MIQETTIKQLKSRLQLSPAGCSLFYTETCGSTNDLAREACRAGCETPCVFLTDEQTGGKGRFDRVWESVPGASLTFSLLFRPACDVSGFPMLTEVFALAVREAFFKTCGIRSDLKWPNDIVIGGRKVCGILTVATEDLQAVVIGAGINLKQSAYPAELSDRAVSIEEALPAFREDKEKTKVPQETVPKPEELLLEIINTFWQKLAVFYRTGDMTGLQKEYEDHLVNTGRRASLQENGHTLTGVAKGIDRKGRLAFQTEDGQLIYVDSGEVSVQGLYGG